MSLPAKISCRQGALLTAVLNGTSIVVAELTPDDSIPDKLASAMICTGSCLRL